MTLARTAKPHSAGRVSEAKSAAGVSRGDRKTSARNTASQQAAPDNPARVWAFAGTGVQRKAVVGAVDDPLEREADRAADAVLAGNALPALNHAAAGPQRKCAACEAEEEVRRSPAAGHDEHAVVQMKAAAPAPAETGAEAAVSALSSGGVPLPAHARDYFEPRFGRDFSAVRLHTDGSAAAAADRIGARAFAFGRHIGFAAGEYAPAGLAGRRLIARALAHVVQQTDATDASPSRVMRAAKEAGADKTPGAPGAPGAGPANSPATSPAGAQPQKLRFDILGADTELADFLAKG